MVMLFEASHKKLFIHKLMIFGRHNLLKLNVNITVEIQFPLLIIINSFDSTPLSGH